MTLLDELRADRVKSGVPCSVCAFVKTRDETERGEWATAFGDPSISNAAIYRAMKARGYAYTDATIGKHRRNGHVAD